MPRLSGGLVKPLAKFSCEGQHPSRGLWCESAGPPRRLADGEPRCRGSSSRPTEGHRVDDRESLVDVRERPSGTPLSVGRLLEGGIQVSGYARRRHRGRRIRTSVRFRPPPLITWPLSGLSLRDIQYSFAWETRPHHRENGTDTLTPIRLDSCPVFAGGWRTAARGATYVERRESR